MLDLRGQPQTYEDDPKFGLGGEILVTQKLAECLKNYLAEHFILRGEV